MEGPLARVDVLGNQRSIGISLTPGVKPGDYVLVHAGFAIQIIGPAEAEETLALLGEWAELEEAESRRGGI